MTGARGRRRPNGGSPHGEGVKISFSGAEDKLAQIDGQSQKATISLGRSTTRSGHAKLSLLANRRLLDNADGQSGREAQQDFMIRTWVIDRLGPDDTDPDWNPEALASDTLDALAFTPAQAARLAAGWRDLPIQQIRELKRHKNLTAHLEILVGYLPPGPVRERAVTWTATRSLLP